LLGHKIKPKCVGRWYHVDETIVMKKWNEKKKENQNSQVRFNQSLGGTAALGVAEEEKAAGQSGSVIVDLRGLR
jgi:hypothetical protein